MLQLVEKNKNVNLEQAKQDHLFLINSYLQSHAIRNHSPKTIAKEKGLLNHWFELYAKDGYPLFSWQAMAPMEGRERTNQYAIDLQNNCVTNQTVRSHLGILSRYFSYVLEHPYVKHHDQYERIDHFYGPIEQPISEYDIPVHIYDGEQMGIPLDPELLYEFYACLREHYLDLERTGAAVRIRNYTLAVIAGESGLRADELLHLELSDLFFKSNKIQTRFAKGTMGSGKRARVTLFPPLARDTTQYFLAKHRHLLIDKKSNLLFCGSAGEVLTYNSIRMALREMIYIAQKNSIPMLDHMSWHWFRRIFATRFIERFPHQLPLLVELLGHISPNTVHRYIRHSNAWIDKKIVQSLEETSLWPSIGD